MLSFVALVGVNSIITVPTEAKTAIVTPTTFLLSMALAAMGLETDITKLRTKGIRPLILELATFLFIAGFSLMLVGLYVMAMAEHRSRVSRGSCTVLGAPGGETPPGNSTKMTT